MTGARIEGQTAAVLCRVAVPIAVAVTVFAGAGAARADSSPTDGTDPGATAPITVDVGSGDPTPEPTPAPPATGTTPTAGPTTGPSRVLIHGFLRNLDTRDAQGPSSTSGTSAGPRSTAKPHSGSVPAKDKTNDGSCPLPPPQHHDNGDHGFFTVKVQAKPSNQFLVQLTFRCYDTDGPQNAIVSFHGVAPTGAGQPVKVLSGVTKFTFKGNESTSIIDAQQTYLLDPTVLGAPASGSWHVRIDVPITPDNSASRAALIVLGTGPQPTPSVLGFKTHVPASTLPTTGGELLKVYGIGIVATSIGLYLWYVGGIPVRKPKHRL
jgi:hypothetical protein